MSEPKFTPGPWKRDDFGNVKDSFDRSVGFSSLMIVCAGNQERIDEAEANTDLLSAAPELLECCMELVQLRKLGVSQHVLVGKTYEKAEAAIAKALGKS